MLVYLRAKSPIVLILLQRLLCVYIKYGKKKVEKYELDVQQNIRTSEHQNNRTPSPTPWLVQRATFLGGRIAKCRVQILDCCRKAFTHNCWKNGLGNHNLPFVYVIYTKTVRFVKDMLKITLLSYLKGHPYVHFQRDNSRPHIVRRTRNFLWEISINVIAWLYRFTDLNPIVHI